MKNKLSFILSNPVFWAGWLCLAGCFLIGIDTAVAQQKSIYYRFREDIHAKYSKDTTTFAMQMKAMDFSINGFFKDAVETFDPQLISVSDNALRHFEAEEWTLVDAREYILRQASDEKVMVINEVHHCSRNRWFTASLLKGLYQAGYRYLGLEAMMNVCDSAVNQRGYVVWNDGFYTREPEFGNLIHEALSLGFKVFGYEAMGKKTADEREREQVKNIMKFLSAHSEGKVLIHCGYDHVNEYRTHAGRRAMMAEMLKDTLGLDIFTVSQSKSVEGKLSFCTEGRNNDPVVLVNSEGKVFNGVSNPQTDCWVIYLPTEYIDDNRPLWQTYGRQPYELDIRKITGFPVLVLVYREGEQIAQGTPADILQIDGKEDCSVLYLKPGRYEYAIYDSDYRLIESRKINL